MRLARRYPTPARRHPDAHAGKMPDHGVKRGQSDIQWKTATLLILFFWFALTVIEQKEGMVREIPEIVVEVIR